MSLDLTRYQTLFKRTDLVRVVGKVVQVVGLVVEAQVQGVSINELCNIEINDGHFIQAEAVGFKEERVLLMPLGTLGGIRPGSKVYALGHPLEAKVGPGLLGRVLDGLGNPLDKKGDLE